ncbi:MAG: TRAP transporter small permease [Candidatus Methylomirabilota bacterium]
MPHGLLDMIDRAIERLIALFSALGGGLMVLLTLVVFGEIVSRYFLGLPITFSSELTSVIFPWIVFLMAVEVTQRNDHIAITLFCSLGPPWLRRAMTIFTLSVMLFFSACLTYSSYLLCVASQHITLPVLTFLTKVYQYSAITVSFALVSIVLLLRLLREIWRDGPPLHPLPSTAKESCQ